MNEVMQKVRQIVKTVSAMPFMRHKYTKRALFGLVLLVCTFGLSYGYSYAISPSSVRKPQFEHAHFRMQVLVDGKPVNFGEQKFQETYATDGCSAELARTPIHFHDNKDQFVHIHWKGITGGQVLKYYGWNYIGGVDGMLGYRFDKSLGLQAVSIHAMALPKVPKDASFYVYSGDEHGYTERSFKDFTRQDLETFFGVRSNVQPEDLSLWNKLFPKAAAHGTEDNGAAPGERTQEELKRINNLLGNVVIFVQKDKPSDQQVKDRFNKLEPLSDSVCAG